MMKQETDFPARFWDLGGGYEQVKIIKLLTLMSKDIHRWAREKGFWDEGIEARNKGEMIALMHSELSEALEAIRKPGQDQHCPEHSALAIELADTVIRILDFCEAFNLPLGEALIAKMRFNAGRPHKHGKAF